MTPAWNPPPGPKSPWNCTYSANKRIKGISSLATTLRIRSCLMWPPWPCGLAPRGGESAFGPAVRRSWLAILAAPSQQRDHAGASGEHHCGFAQGVVAAVAGQHRGHHVGHIHFLLDLV